MTDPFIAEVKILPYTFVPRGWAACDGQTMNIVQNTALYSIIQNWYGGDGKTTFALPDLKDRVVVGLGDDGQGNQYSPGDEGGSATVTLSKAELATHTHAFEVSTRPALGRQPAQQVFAVGAGVNLYNKAPKNPTTMDPHMITQKGGSKAHDNLMPYLTVQYCIALQGVYPARG